VTGPLDLAALQAELDARARLDRTDPQAAHRQALQLATDIAAERDRYAAQLGRARQMAVVIKTRQRNRLDCGLAISHLLNLLTSPDLRPHHVGVDIPEGDPDNGHPE
jgi:hypothetical protein